MNNSFVLSFLVFLLLSGCGVLGEQAPLVRDGQGFKNLTVLQQQLRERQALDYDLIDQTAAIFEQENNVLGLADLELIQGTSYFFSMRVDTPDLENLEKATRHLAQSKKRYHSLGEDWLEAKASFTLAYANARAKQYKEMCKFYEDTLKLLNKGKGQLKEFDYNKSQFSSPQQYVEGVFANTCEVLERGPERKNFDENGNLIILKRS
jgi:hypothetical protein